MKKLGFSRQPLIWLNVIALALELAAAFGFQLDEAQTVALMALLHAVATAVGWTQVTPVAAPNLRPPHVPDPGDPPIT